MEYKYKKKIRDELYKTLESNPENSSQYLIAKVIIDKLNDNEELNIMDIAKRTFNNKSTITRFCQNLGFDGFKDFSREILEQDSAHYFSTDLKTYHKSYIDYTYLIKDTIDELGEYEEEIVRIVQIIKEKNRIFIFTTPENVEVGNNFAGKLRFLGINAFSAVYNKHYSLLHTIKNEDLVIFFISGLDTNILWQIWNFLNPNNKTVLITTPTHKTKFKNPNYAIYLQIQPNILREMLKPFLMNYLTDQILNLLVYSEEKFLSTLVSPSYKI